jgi:hypothetical protein
MEEIIKILEKTNKIYDEKLEDAISLLKKTDVEDDAFDKLLNKVSSLIALKIQKENFIEDYKNRPIRIATKEEK